MRINNISISNYRGEEKSGYDRFGEPFRKRTAEILWMDEDGKRTNKVVASMSKQPLDEIDRRHIAAGQSFDADICFSTSTGSTGYLFTNIYINKIY